MTQVRTADAVHNDHRREQHPRLRSTLLLHSADQHIYLAKF